MVIIFKQGELIQFIQRKRVKNLSNSLKKKLLENPEKREIWSKAKKGKIQKIKENVKMKSINNYQNIFIIKNGLMVNIKVIV